MTYLTYKIVDHIACIGLDRPDKRNALNDQMMQEFEELVEDAAEHAKAAVLFSTSEHFSAGLDLAEHIEKTAIQSIQGSRKWHNIFAKIQRGSIPYFSVLSGAVVGGGLELAAATHVRVAEPNTHFALPEGSRGIFVGGGGSVNITRLIGVSRMTDMMLTGRVLTAPEAERYGLVNYLCESGQGFETALALAKKAAVNSPISNYSILNALPRIHDSGFDEGLFFESMVAAFTQTTEEAKDGLRKFLSKQAAPLNIPNTGSHQSEND